MNEINGYFKLFRKLVQWGWYQNNNVKAVFLHCLIRVNFSDQPFEGMIIKRGQFVTSEKNLASELGLSRQQVRTAINKLKSTNEITTQSTNKFTIVTVTNWEKYQNGIENTTNEITNTVTNEQPTNNQRITNEQPQYKNIKNDKNDKNDKNIFIEDEPPKKTKSFIPPTVEEVRAYCLERSSPVDAEQFVNYYSAIGWLVGKNKMKDWRAAVRTWERNYRGDNQNKQIAKKSSSGNIFRDMVNELQNQKEKEEDYIIYDD